MTLKRRGSEALHRKTGKQIASSGSKVQSSGTVEMVSLKRAMVSILVRRLLLSNGNIPAWKEQGVSWE